MGMLKTLLTVGDAGYETEDESAATPEEISKQKLEAALDRMIAERGQGASHATVPAGSSTLMALDVRRDAEVARAAAPASKAVEARPAGLSQPRSGGFGRRTQRPA